MTIEFDEETQQLIEQEINAGHFPDAASLLGAAMRHFVVTRGSLGYTREEIDAMIDEGIASLERGEGVVGEEFFAEWERAQREGSEPRP